MIDKLNNAFFVVLVIIALWSTYQFGYNKGFNEAMQTSVDSQNRTLNSLQLANDYQQLYLKCLEQ